MVLFFVIEPAALIQLAMAIATRPRNEAVMRLQCATLAVDVLIAVRSHDCFRVAIADAVNANLTVLPLRRLQVVARPPVHLPCPRSTHCLQ